MKKSLLLAALVGGAACQPAAGPLTDADRQMIMDTAAAQSRAMYADLNTRDYGKIMSHYVAGEFISSENGMTYRNRAAIDSSGRAFWGALKTVAFTKVSDKVQVLDRDNFVLSSQWHMVAADSAGHNMDMTGAWVGTFHRTDAGFKVVAESNSMSGGAMPPPPAARRRS